MIPPPLRCIQRNAEACGAARMDRSEGKKPKGRESGTVLRPRRRADSPCQGEMAEGQKGEGSRALRSR